MSNGPESMGNILNKKRNQIRSFEENTSNLACEMEKPDISG